jgi:hypothetical protein
MYEQKVTKIKWIKKEGGRRLRGQRKSNIY